MSQGYKFLLNFLYGSSLWNYQEVKINNQTFRTIFIWFLLVIEISSPMVNIGFVIDAPLSLSSGIDGKFQ